MSEDNQSMIILINRGELDAIRSYVESTVEINDIDIVMDIEN